MTADDPGMVYREWIHDRLDEIEDSKKNKDRSREYLSQIEKQRIKEYVERKRELKTRTGSYQDESEFSRLLHRLRSHGVTPL